MTDPRKETVWITIPDEASPASTDSPALQAAMEAYGRDPADKVRNKGFWAVGFVVLVAFLFLLLAPQRFVSLLQGDLFFREQEGARDQRGGAHGEQGEQQAVAADRLPQHISAPPACCRDHRYAVGCSSR